jgi:prepilin-type N-terminal cleavage/methylation domain-containing protein
MLRAIRSRRGVTLLEVLIALFIMAIGLLALLTLFPLGALSMAQALQSDRALSASQLAAEYAEMMDLFDDADVNTAFVTPPPGYTQPPDDETGPSWPVLVDPFGYLVNPTPIGASPVSPGIARVRPVYATTPSLAARWFGLTDDLTFAPDATPAGGVVQRGGRYTWTYLLRRPRANTPSVVEMTIVVYSGRDTQTGTGEQVYSVVGVRGESMLQLTYTTGQGKPALRSKSWLLDVTYDTKTRRTRGAFLRVVNVEEAGPTSLTLELADHLEGNVESVVVLENALEVFTRGLTRAP